MLVTEVVIQFEHDKQVENQILDQKNQFASHSESKITTRFIINLKVYNASDFQLKFFLKI